MANRGRNYMDRLLGRNEESDEESYFDDRFGDEHLDHRLQATRSRPRPNFYKTAAERDYSTRRNPPEERSSLGSQYSSQQFVPRGFFGKGPKGYKRSDEKIKEDVSEALYRDYHVDASEIEVEVKEGIVTLSGTVDSRQSKRAAEECIEHLSGVNDVHNRIRIMEKGDVSNLQKGPDKDENRALS